MAISQGSQGRGTLFTEINITPLTDIFLVLLIIMMVIAPMFQSTNEEIKPPSINAGQGIEEGVPTVEITKGGDYFINGEKVSVDSLETQLKQLATKTQQEHLVVRADTATHSSVVLKVFEAAGQSGFKKMTIAGEPLSEKRQSQLMQGDSSVNAPGEVAR